MAVKSRQAKLSLGTLKLGPLAAVGALGSSLVSVGCPECPDGVAIKCVFAEVC